MVILGSTLFVVRAKIQKILPVQKKHRIFTPKNQFIMAKVCNPIYDTVFNAIINDARYTGILLGGILNNNIVDVEIKSCVKSGA